MNPFVRPRPTKAARKAAKAARREATAQATRRHIAHELARRDQLLADHPITLQPTQS